jgi:hypothetical protein
MRHPVAAMVGLLLATGTAPPAGALVVTYEFTGTVTELLVDGGLFGAPGTVQVGDPFTGHFSYEVGSENPDQLPGDAELGRYELTAFVVDQSAAPLAPTPFGVGVTHQPGLPTLPPSPPDLGLDRLSIVSTSDVYPSRVSLVLEGPFESAFLSDSLPLALELSDFPDVAMVRGLVAVGLFPNPSIQDLGVLTSLVPGPGVEAAAAAAALALAGLATWRGPSRRKRRPPYPTRR